MFKAFDSYIFSCHETQNTGHDILLYTTQWASRNLLDDKTNAISCLSTKENEEFGDTAALTPALFPGHHQLLHYRNAMRSQKILFGGGAVFQSEGEIQIKRRMLHLSNKHLSRCVGVSLGPFNSIQAEKECAKFLNECGFIGVRDIQSLEIAQALAPRANVHLTFDLSPLMLCHKTNKVVPIERKGVMFNFCHPEIAQLNSLNHNMTRKQLLEAIDTVKEVWNETNEPIYFVDLNGHPKSGDFHIHEQIITRLPGHIPILHIAYDPNPFRVLQRIAGFKAIVSMRLHGSILGFLTETPVISISYSEKCNSWCQQIGISQDYQHDAHYICPTTIASSLSKGIRDGFLFPQMTIQESIQLAKLNWS